MSGRCDCGVPLNPSEMTARFVDPDPKAPPRYVMMCKKCRSFLPPDIVIVTRRDLDPGEKLEVDDHEEDKLWEDDYEDT